MSRIKRKENNTEAPADLSLEQETDLKHGGKWTKWAKWYSPEQRRAAWEKHRQEFMGEYIGSGKRPRAFWDYDMPGALDGYPKDSRGITTGPGELQAIVDLGLATDYEKRLHEAGVDPHRYGTVYVPLHTPQEEET